MNEELDDIISEYMNEHDDNNRAVIHYWLLEVKRFESTKE